MNTQGEKKSFPFINSHKTFSFDKKTANNYVVKIGMYVFIPIAGSDNDFSAGKFKKIS